MREPEDTIQLFAADIFLTFSYLLAHASLSKLMRPRSYELRLHGHIKNGQTSQLLCNIVAVNEAKMKSFNCFVAKRMDGLIS